MFPAILSEWLRKARLLQSALYLLAISMVLGLPLAGQVRGQTQVNVISVAGGSSALLGDFSELTFREGPVPLVIESAPEGITGYRPAGVPDSGLMVTTSVVVRDPDHPDPPGDPLETVSNAMIRWYRQDGSNINVIILLRSDSGNGVRYVSNFARITDFPNAFRQRQPDGTFIDATGDAFLVAQALVNNYLDVGRAYDGSSLSIESGYSDVTADTVVRYANFPNLHAENLRGIIQTTGPVQTLLILHNKNMVYGAFGAEQLVFPRVAVKAAMNSAYGPNLRWSQLDPFLQNTLLMPTRRENTSGTRMTEYTNIQRKLPASPLRFLEDDIPVVSQGSGAMLNYVNLIDASFGYQFVGGVNGDMRPNIRVGGYTDSDGNTGYPYPITNGAGPDCSLPGNNNQARYSDQPYQTGVIDGTYPLWGYANVFSRPEDQFATGAACEQSVFAALLNDSVVNHNEGLLLPGELSVERNYFISSITGEVVTDGERVVPIGTAQQVGEPDQDDPNP